MDENNTGNRPVNPRRRKRTQLQIIKEDYLPAAIIGMLVIYCLKDVDVLRSPYGLPELMAGAATVGIHVWKRNSLVSILSGTIVYMILIQLVF